MADQPAQTTELAPAATDQGAMERLFLLEATTPAYVRKFSADDNLAAMRLMRQTIENRLKSPREYGASGARTPTDIVELGNQFAGFDAYPVLNAQMSANLADILRIASNSRDSRQAAYVRFVQDAVTAATEKITPPTANYPNVTAWRTHGSASPGPRFRDLATLSGNTFYSTVPVPPHPPHHVRRQTQAAPPPR